MCSDRRPPARRPRWRRRGHRVGAAALAAVAVLAAACGKKGDPEPPLRFVPRPATDLTVAQRGGELVLGCSYPKLATNGRALPGLASVELWHLGRPLPPSGEASPPDPRQFAAAAAIAATLSGDDLTAAVRGDRLALRWPLGDLTAPERQLHAYAVRFVSTRGERSDFSNVAAIAPVPPPAPPAGLALEAREDGIEVSWTAGGSEVTGYRLYRRESEERDYGAALASVEATTASYLDASAHLGNRYVYAVTAVASAAPPIESAVGAEREIDYRDRFPPAAPKGLVALAEAGRVRLSWQASEAADVAGYQVYRRDEPGGEFHRRTDAPLTATTFVDEGTAAGRSYAYRVTAVDASGNESPPGAEVTVAAR
jgi:hypothetical protein